MKSILIALLFIILISQGCGNGKSEINHFTTSMDTLVIRTAKQRGGGLFLMGVTYTDFRDTAGSFPYSIVYPERVGDLERMQLITDFKAEKRNYIDIIKGKIGETQVIIVDENNNEDLTDDSIRIPQSINWHSEAHLIPCRYTIAGQSEIGDDSTWLRLGVLRNNLFVGRSEHLIAEFWIDNENYVVGIADPRAGDFTYKRYAEAALLSHNSYVRDTLLERDLFKQGEILKLNENYYRFEHISYFGEYISLVREHDFNRLVGTQVGMIAPDFTCVSVAGDTINSKDLHDRILVIANSCGCGGDTRSTEAYDEILDGYGEKIHILRLDSKIDRNLKGHHIDMEDEYNKDIYLKFRNAYCSRTCYVVDNNNRVLDKFLVTDWSRHLPEFIN